MRSGASSARECSSGRYTRTKTRRPFVGEDGVWRLRLGRAPEFTFWLDDEGALCFGADHGGLFLSGRSIDGKREFDEPALLNQFSLN